MARGNTRRSFNLEVAVTGERPTDELPTTIAEKKETKLMVAGQVESAAAQASARSLAVRTFGKKEREEKGDRETDSHSNSKAVARSVFWERRREEKQKQASGSLGGNPNDETVGESTVAAINRNQISMREGHVKILTPFRSPDSPREQALAHLTS